MSVFGVFYAIVRQIPAGKVATYGQIARLAGMPRCARTVGYAMANRSAVVRIPAYATAPKNKRFELRNPDATCNPYYAFAAILMAGLDGIQNKIDPKANGWGPYDFNLFDLPEEEKAKIGGLPKSLEEALDALEQDHDYLTQGGVFPQRLLDIWVEKKRKEINKMNRVPHPMEYAMYYDL